jgi:hypothetical protein
MWLKWTKGRQNTGYEKMLIFQFLSFDCYLLRYKVGDSIPWHCDPVPNLRHFRLNFELKKAEEGGIFIINRNIIRLEKYNKIVKSRFVFFRSDIHYHKVTEIRKGERIVLTFGAAI